MSVKTCEDSKVITDFGPSTQIAVAVRPWKELMFGINTKTLSGHCTGHQLIQKMGRIPLRSKYYILMGHYSYNRDFRKSLTKKKQTQEKTLNCWRWPATGPTDPYGSTAVSQVASALRLRAVLYGVAEWQDRFPPPGGVDGIHEGKIGDQEFSRDFRLKRI